MSSEDIGKPLARLLEPRVAEACDDERDQRVDGKAGRSGIRPKISTARVCSTGQATGLSAIQARIHSGSADSGKKIGDRNINAVTTVPRIWLMSRK